MARDGCHDGCQSHAGQSESTPVDRGLDVDAISEPYVSRFLARIDRSGGPDSCWPWLAGHDNLGYGSATIAPMTKERAHRISVILDGRTIPDGYTVDHICFNRGCQNPAHLEVVTRAENVRREGPHKVKSHCKNGHETPMGSRTERGNCRECVRIRQRANGARYWQNHKARRAA